MSAAFTRLVNNAVFSRVAPNDGATTTFTLAAGTSDVNSVGVDTRGYNELTFVIIAGTMAASSSLAASVEYSSDNVTYTAVSSSSITGISATDDDKIALISLKDLKYRYYRVAFVRGDGGNCTIDGLLAILGAPAHAAVTQGATVDSTTVVAPGS